MHVQRQGDGHADPALRCQVAGDDNDDNDDGIARDDRIDGGRHGPCAPRGRTVDVVAVAKRSGAVRKCADACSIDCHQRANVRVFVLGRGRRDDGADGVVVVGSDGGACGDVTAAAAALSETTTPTAMTFFV